MTEVERIREEYERRAREIPSDTYAFTNPVNLFFIQQRTRAALDGLRRIGFLPLTGKHALEIGCGTGGWLPLLEQWGAGRGDLAGIDLDHGRVARARRLLSEYRDECRDLFYPGADIRCGDAAGLPWSDGSFDLVVQSTVLTSILDAEMKRAVAAEMLRTLAPGGIILWYDFRYNNPWNPHVRGIGKREIRSLFPFCNVSTRRITLAPPLARRVVPYTWLGATLLEALGFLNSHYLAIIRKS